MQDRATQTKNNTRNEIAALISGACHYELPHTESSYIPVDEDVEIIDSDPPCCHLGHRQLPPFYP